MAQELKVKPTQLGQNTVSQIVEEEPEMEEILMRPRQSLYDRVHEMAERFATTRIGQFVIERGDRVLKMIENTAKWSLPQADKTELKLERSLPWIPFLSLIIILRLVRIWVSVAALLIGNGPVTPQEMVYFIQTRRRKLRAIRVQGLKVMRSREMEVASSSSSSSNVGFVGKMKTLLSRAICRPGQHSEPARRIFVHHVQVNTNRTDVDRPAVKRLRDDDNCDPNLTVSEMLTKYANEDSDDDSDFIPNPHEESNDDDTTSSGTSSDETETDTNVKNVHETQSDGYDGNAEIMGESEQARAKPKPLLDIQKEKLSDVDSGNEQMLTPIENGPTNDTDNRETEVAPKHKSMRKSHIKAKSLYGHTYGHHQFTSGCDSANTNTATASAIGKPKSRIGFGATAGSPPEFDNFQDCANYKTPTISFGGPNDGSMHSAAVEETTFDPTAPATGPFRRQAPHYTQRQNQQHQSHQFRNRGRNRR